MLVIKWFGQFDFGGVRSFDRHHVCGDFLVCIAEKSASLLVHPIRDWCAKNNRQWCVTCLTKHQLFAHAPKLKEAENLTTIYMLWNSRWQTVGPFLLSLHTCRNDDRLWTGTVIGGGVLHFIKHIYMWKSSYAAIFDSKRTIGCLFGPINCSAFQPLFSANQLGMSKHQSKGDFAHLVVVLADLSAPLQGIGLAITLRFHRFITHLAPFLLSQLKMR